MSSTETLNGINVYLGDIHGTRLTHLDAALERLGIEPDGLLSTMDLDQVLAIRQLRDLERRYLDAGKAAYVVPGNHEAAIIYSIGIDSATYRKSKQDTSIFELIEKIYLPDFAQLRTYVERKLAIVGGQRVRLDASARYPALLIHAALAGRQERYIEEFPEELQTHVRDRFDLWLRLIDRGHLDDNFRGMTEHGIQTMLRGHDHYVALRSQGEDGALWGHQVVLHKDSTDAALEHRTESVRAEDAPDDMALLDPRHFAAVRDAGDIYWHELLPERRYVVNFGPYYMGYFGLVRAGTGDHPPAVAFCRTEVSFFTAEDRQEELQAFTLAQRAAAGASFYTLFPRD